MGMTAYTLQGCVEGSEYSLKGKGWLSALGVPVISTPLVRSGEWLGRRPLSQGLQRRVRHQKGPVQPGEGANPIQGHTALDSNPTSATTS